MSARRSLLDDGDDDGASPEVTLTVNAAYASRFEHNKQREDVHRLREMQKQGLVDESDSSEDDEDDDDEDSLLPKSTEVETFFDTLAKIKKKDPAIYKKSVSFFEEEESDEEDEQDAGRKRKQKPVYLKDVTAQHAFDAEDEDEEEDVRDYKTYAEEQQALKDEFLKSVAEADDEAADDEEGLFKAKRKSKQELEQEPELAVAARRANEFFGKDESLDENDRFLKNYLVNQGWIDKQGEQQLSVDPDEVSEDEKYLNKQDRFEASYNFRFEEKAGSQVGGHSRIVENSVRKLSDKRKEQRKSKTQRLSEQETARREEVKRLKNVKKKEILQKIDQIKRIAGATTLEEFAEDYLDEEFDPEAHDKKMKEAFDEEYYEDEDPDGDFHSDEEKPNFDAEDVALGLEKGWDGRQSSLPAPSKEEIDKYMEEYNNLDIELGDVPMKFNYAQVKPNKFGLDTAQILDADDKELNQYISLKFLAPYRTDEPVPQHKHYRQTKKERKRKSMDQIPSVGNKQKDNAEDEQATEPAPKKKKQKKQEESKSAPKQEKQVPTQRVEAGEGESSQKKKSRSRKKGLGLSQNRLLAYGKIQPPKRK